MEEFSISNKTAAPLQIMLEPMADTFEVPSLETARVRTHFDPTEPVEIDVYPDNFISIWVIGHVDVDIGEKRLSFPEL